MHSVQVTKVSAVITLLGDFVKDFYELSMILISYELELNPGIKSNPTDQRKC